MEIIFFIFWSINCFAFFYFLDKRIIGNKRAKAYISFFLRRDENFETLLNLLHFLEGKLQNEHFIFYRKNNINSAL